MKCKKVQRLLNRYIDKELDNKKIIYQIEDHLNTCPHCTDELKSLLSVKELIGQKERITVREDFLIRVNDRLKQGSPIIKIRWVLDTGYWASRLIPIPALTMILVFVLMSPRIKGPNFLDEYLLENLTNQDLAILSGYIKSSDLLINVNIR